MTGLVVLLGFAILFGLAYCGVGHLLIGLYVSMLIFGIWWCQYLKRKEIENKKKKKTEKDIEYERFW